MEQLHSTVSKERACIVYGRYCNYLDIKTKEEMVEFKYGRLVHSDLYIRKCTAY
jgi:hypothetical protein